MNDLKSFAAAGVLLYGAIYTIGLIAAALVGHYPHTLQAALACAGFVYVCFAAQVLNATGPAISAMIVSVGMALVGAYFLIMGM